MRLTTPNANGREGPAIWHEHRKKLGKPEAVLIRHPRGQAEERKARDNQKCVPPHGNKSNPVADLLPQRIASLVGAAK